MKSSEEAPIIAFTTQQDWEAWLAEHHTEPAGIWLKISKKGAGVPSISYAEALEGALWLDCDQVDELSAKLAAAGTTIIKPPFDGPFGRTFFFADPDGYRITANQNPWDRFPLGGRQQGA